MRISDWSSDVCSSDLHDRLRLPAPGERPRNFLRPADLHRCPHRVDCRSPASSCPLKRGYPGLARIDVTLADPCGPCAAKATMLCSFAITPTDIHRTLTAVWARTTEQSPDT